MNPPPGASVAVQLEQPIAEQAPAAPKREARKQARAGLAMSIATFAMAAASAIQAVLYLGRFGVDGRTDGFFAAFALYTTFGVFSQSLRVAAVPLLVKPDARLSTREFAGVLSLLGALILVATVVLADPLAGLLAPGLSEANRGVTESALPILGGATVLQLLAAGGATLLAIRGRFTTVAGAYIAGAGMGLAAYIALMGTAGELTLGWSMLTMAVVTCGWMLIGVYASGGFDAGEARLRVGQIARKTGLMLGLTVVYLAFNLLFVITLSFASHGGTGDATVLSYAYLLASYLVAGTGMALGMSRIPDMARKAKAERRKVLTKTVPQGFRYAIMLVLPVLGAVIVAGAPLVHKVFPNSLSADGVETLRVFIALLVPWTVAALLVNFLLPPMFALGRGRLLNLLALPLVVVHVAVTAIASALWGVNAVVAAFTVAPALFGAILLVAGAGPDWPRVARELARDCTRWVVFASLSFGITGGVALALLGSGWAPALLAGTLGASGYAVALLTLAREQIDVLLGAVRSGSA
jgi:peptidoglycan biosynthesis protein MviN/MurJ (putative lipid II flippase)